MVRTRSGWLQTTCRLCAGLLLQCGAAWAEVYRVQAGAAAGGDGLSWISAFASIQAALGAAGQGDEIWVAAGRYVPGNSRTSSFRLEDGVALYGGFSGTETQREQRDWAAHPTILSGDVLGDDDGFLNMSENVYHVVRGANDAVLDGFVIEGGNADALTDPDAGGGGMLNDRVSPTVVRCLFRRNRANYYGGAMHNVLGAPAVEACVFLGNTAAEFAGGAVANLAAQPTFTNCVFAENSGFYFGGALYNDLSDPVFVGCTLTRNHSKSGGGMANVRSMPAIGHSILWGNEAEHTGAEVDNEESVPRFAWCDVAGSRGSGDTWKQSLGTDEGGNLDADPRFADALLPAGADGRVATSDDGLHLLADSPCLDAGQAAGAPETDLLGRPRTQGSGPDLGAYEGPVAPRSVPALAGLAAVALAACVLLQRPPRRRD